MAGLAGHRFRGIGGAAGFGRIAWIGGLKPISTARLYSHLYSPLVLQCLEQAVSAAAVSGSG
ncbi:hypothetical protein COH84_03485 [Neisseria meningitidis]|uniref:Uncharacterized protein n=1 Tax=Neisseria meningitidis TaxID=487 RepID=A0A425AZ88_NEIME|nr:hypothetical protein [Neisseria meningitidis]MBG8634411.1 hypothetical protein [Neisseria meningitidis]MBG8660877.1 hypothetical protein [Neisseria meningitidis]MBG8746008.1 hypothetical protein [Neisseria meningitidis]MBG8768559.1 hypothetical protein [Neisseria meningitidis]